MAEEKKKEKSESQKPEKLDKHQLQDISGVGPKLEDKLVESGLRDPMAIAVSSPGELASILEIGEATAGKIINGARQMLEMGFTSADKVWEQRKKMAKITTSSENLDNLLGGGVETQAITEIYGGFGSGKTQIAFQLAVNVQLSEKKGGLGANCLFIDTENSLPYDEKILIATKKGYEFVKIGKLVEERIENGDKKEFRGTLFTEDNPEKIKAVSFDPKSFKINTFEITGFMKHPENDIYEVTLASGRKVRVTSHHNFFTLSEQGDLREISTDELNEDTFVAIPGKLPEIKSPDILELDELFYENKLFDFYVRGDTKFIKFLKKNKKLLKEVSKSDYHKDSYHSFATNGSLPLKIFMKIKDSLPENILNELRIGSWSRTNSLPIQMKIDEELVRFLGFYLAEGCCLHVNNSVLITTGKEKGRRIIQDFADLNNLNVQEVKNGFDFKITSKTLLNFLDIIGIGKNSHEKSIPPFIFGLDENLKSEFLESYLFGDGTVDSITGQTSCETVSEDLKSDLLYFTMGIGIPSRGYLIRRKKTKRDGFNISHQITWATEPRKDPKLLHIPNSSGQVGGIIRQCRNQNNLTMEKFSNNLGYRTLTPISQVENSYVKKIGRTKLNKFIGFLKKYKPTKRIEILDKLVKSNIWFDRVKNIEKTGKEPTYDVEVLPKGKKIQNFVAGNGGIFLHNTFRPNRIIELAKALELDEKEILKNIFVARAYNSDHQMFLVDQASDMIEKNNVKLIVVDSLTSHFRAEYMGRGQLAPRQQKLNKHLHALQRMADAHNLAVYVTNQVQANPAILFGDPTKPVGGHIVAHQTSYRLYLRKSKGEKRIAKIMDSPDLPPGECVFKVLGEGVRD